MLNGIKKAIKLNIAQHYWNLKGSFKYYNQTVYFPKNSIIFKRAVKDGIYEHDILSFIIPLIKPNSEVFDIGANIGLIAVPLLTSEQSINLVSVEASPNSLPFLKKTNLASSYKDRWFIIDKAVSDKPGKIEFHLAGNDNGAYDSINDTKRASFVSKIEIDCTTIDAIWKNRNKPEVSVIKSDIEGADLLALFGGIECIKACRPSILIEWNLINIKPFELKNKDLFDFVQSINYVLYALPGVNKINCLSDLELLSNYTENFLLIPATE
jgi:FkbM family methyltransferase